MAELLIGLFTWAAATGAGMRFLRVAGVRVSPAEKWTFGSALGLGVFAYLVFIFGSFRMLGRPFWVVLIGAVFLLCVTELLRAWNEAVADRPQKTLLLKLVCACAGLAMLGALFGALAPAIGQDELCYHLSQPANYVREGRVYAVPFSTNALWPYLMEMLFTLGLVLRDESVAKFFHWAMTITAAGAVYCWVRRLGGSFAGAKWAALIYLATPAVFLQASFAYVDSALAGYTLLAILALVVALRENSVRWAILGGIFSGLAASTKLLGLFSGLLALAAVLAAVRAGGVKNALKCGGAFFAAAVVAGGLWYVRSWILRGNPVFPFYPEIFGAGWHDPTYVDAHGRPGLLGFLAFPLDFTLRPAWFGGEAPGPLYLMLVPAAFILGAAPLYARLGAVFGFLYAVLWYLIDPNARFFFPALLFFAAPAGHAAAELTVNRDKFALALRGILLAVFAGSAALGVYHFHDAAGSVLRGDRDSYLRRNERSFAVAQAVNGQLEAGDKVLAVGEVRGYAFNLKHPFVLEGDFENMTRYTAKASDAAGVVAFLREQGFTHVLIADFAAPSDDKRRLVSLLSDEAVRRQFFKETVAVRSGGAHYSLYRIL